MENGEDPKIKPHHEMYAPYKRYLELNELVKTIPLKKKQLLEDIKNM